MSRYPHRHLILVSAEERAAAAAGIYGYSSVATDAMVQTDVPASLPRVAGVLPWPQALSAADRLRVRQCLAALSGIAL